MVLLHLQPDSSTWSQQLSQPEPDPAAAAEEPSLKTWQGAIPECLLFHGIGAQTARANDLQIAQQATNAVSQTYTSIVSPAPTAMCPRMASVFAHIGKLSDTAVALQCLQTCPMKWGESARLRGILPRSSSPELQDGSCWHIFLWSSYACSSLSATGRCCAFRLLQRWLTGHAHAWPSPQLLSGEYPLEASPAASGPLCCTTPPPVPHSP